MRHYLSGKVSVRGMTLLRRFVATVSALSVGVTLVATAEAGPSGGGSRGGSSHGGSSFHEGSRSYHEEFGTRFRGGYLYRGRDHSHWTYRYWWSNYGCFTYYCPSTYCWYYWYPKHECYYPVSYITHATPVAQSVPFGVETAVKQIVNVTNNSPGASTGGGVPFSPGQGPVGPVGPPVGGPAPMPPAPPG